MVGIFMLLIVLLFHDLMVYIMCYLGSLFKSCVTDYLLCCSKFILEMTCWLVSCYLFSATGIFRV